MTDVSWQLGRIRIHAPDPGKTAFWFYTDLAELFGCEYTSEAVGRFRESWKLRGTKRRIAIDAEADGVSFQAARQAIIEVALVIHELASIVIDPAELAHIRGQVDSYIVPDPVAWSVGDLFALLLLDGSHAHGQVVGEVKRKPSCALLELRTPAPTTDVATLRRARVISVLHVQEHHLSAGEWPIVGNAKPLANAYDGPCGHPSQIGGRSWDGLATLANAYFGLEPWNRFARPDYLEGFLSRGISRPASVILV
jgi:hypothetical protein